MVNTVINALVAFLIGGATLSFSISATDAAGNLQYEGSGTVTTFGENYRMETDEILVVSNGAGKGIYQKGIDEIVFLPIGPSSAAGNAAPGADIMENPFALLKNPGGMYDISTMGMDAEGIPMKIVLKAKTGAAYTISIQKYSKLSAPDSSLFTLNPDDYPSAIVTDLR